MLFSREKLDCWHKGWASVSGVVDGFGMAINLLAYAIIVKAS
jgi:hypothetical protein